MFIRSFIFLPGPARKSSTIKEHNVQFGKLLFLILSLIKKTFCYVRRVSEKISHTDKKHVTGYIICVKTPFCLMPYWHLFFGKKMWN
jgi:hypothetical protein